MKWLQRMMCTHNEVVDGTVQYEDPEDDTVFVFVYCARPVCRKQLGRKVTGYRGDGIYL